MTVAVLTYHAVGRRRSPLWVAPEDLEAQIAALLSAGRQAVRLSEVVGMLERGELPDEAFAVTFDDGYASVYEQALPRLRNLGVPATVFLVTGHVGRTNRWPTQPRSVDEEPLMSWAQAKALVEAGWEIGNHTLTHAPLTELAPGEAEREMLAAREHLHDRLGQQGDLFAFPYGAANAALRRLAGRHFRGVVGTRLGLVKSSSDRLDLERLDAWYLTVSSASRLDSAGFRCLLGLRRAARQVRRVMVSDWSPASVDQAEGMG